MTVLEERTRRGGMDMRIPRVRKFAGRKTEGWCSARGEGLNLLRKTRATSEKGGVKTTGKTTW